MATITEDYVNFEIAKLLKEKGFDESTIGTYYADGSFEYLSLNKWNSKFITPISAPTIQMAMKWLRLKHNIYIDVHLSFSEDPENHPSMYYVYILDTKTGNSLLEKAAHIGELNPLMDVNDHNVPINFDSPEEAAEAALKYVFENLI